MFGRLKYRKPASRKGREGKQGAKSQSKDASPSVRLDQREFSHDIDYNLELFQDLLGMNMDLIIRKFQIQLHKKSIQCGLIYLDGSSSKSDLNDILRALMLDIDVSRYAGGTIQDVVIAQCIPYTGVETKDKPLEAANFLLTGNSLLFLDGFPEAIGLSTQAYQERAVEQPATEQVIQGAREGFIESVGTNVSLIRKRMRSPDLRIKMLQLGRETATDVVYCFIEGIVNKKLVKEVEKRLKLVETDALYGSGYLEQFIEDNHFSPFPQVQNTERPDKAVAALLEGRVIILVDGSPFALIVPAVFSQFYQTTEDYDTRFLMASMIRGIRLLSLLFSLIFPSIYVSLISFNPEMIPTKFAVAVAGGRAGVPFPSIAEVFGLEVIMEIIREATVRLPQQVGGALSIVGVLVIGQSAVQAGFVSPITVIIVALTTIGSFATPAYNAAIALRMLRFPLMVLAGMFGLYGVMVGLIIIANHLNSLESFGVPYLSPVIPGHASGLKDTVVRMPVWAMKKRPKELGTKDPNRVAVDENKLMDSKGRPLSPAVQNNASETDQTSQDPSASPKRGKSR